VKENLILLFVVHLRFFVGYDWVFKDWYFLVVRFHLLSEFDEGKRSCRRRLDGHNRRRRKTQPDAITSQVVALENRDNTSNNTNMDVMALLTALVCAQGTYALHHSPLW
jgi:hypothetical protein